MNINYTLSFSEGTGSSPTSGYNSLQQLIAAGLPNLRTQFPVTTDSRHNINAQIDYRFRDKEGPTIGKHHVFENAGINLVFRARSGEPYTKYATARGLVGGSNSPVILGTVNGSRLKGHYGVDLRIDKTLPLNFRKKSLTVDGPPTASRTSLNIYVYAQNVFNIRDVLGVYGFTGRPDDDAFLESPLGQTTINSQVDAQSFIDLYRVAMNNPGSYNSPRTILAGLRLNF
jgi:hypothetical protein